MARVNVGRGSTMAGTTHEGAPARALTPEQELRRSVLACLLWEDGFYEDGASIVERIAGLVPKVPGDRVAALAVEARSKMYLRHAPLFLVREMARHPSHRPHVRATLASVIQRADELSEFLAIYWKDKKQPLAKSVQRGLADAFPKFNAYQLAKYNRDTPVKLRDALFLSHARPTDWQTVSNPAPNAKSRGAARRNVAGQGVIWTQLVNGTLPVPDTWEVAISACGRDATKKQATWTRLLIERKLGAFALIRNLRNLQKCNVSDALIRRALESMRPDKILPFRFLAALRYAPQFAAELESAMLRNLADVEPFTGMTVILVDGSGSMQAPISAKSEMTRHDAALGVAIAARELSESCRVVAYSTNHVELPAYRGLALGEAIRHAVPADATYMGKAVTWINQRIDYDRIIVITDEQSHDEVPGPKGVGFVINVAVSKPGVGYGPWHHIDGWSDRVLDFVRAVESDRA
jgi:60 kDa SS-A/Ro ribonucleoprotein